MNTRHRRSLRAGPGPARWLWRAGTVALLVTAPWVRGATVEFHTSPACWDQPRIYHPGAPPDDVDLRVHVIETPAIATVPGTPTTSPNGAYAFWVRNPDTGKPGPWGAGLIVDVESRQRPTLLIENVAQPIEPRWINEKLIYLRIAWGRIAFSDLIFDVEQAEIIHHEQAIYGQQAFEQFHQACGGRCPCDPSVSEAPHSPAQVPADDGSPDDELPDDELPNELMPHAHPGPDELIGLLTLPTIFGPAETGGPVAATDPMPVPVYEAPEAGARKLGEPGRPDDFENREYTYEGAAAVVYDRRPGWFQVALADGRRAWVSSKSAGEFLPIGDLLTERPAFLNGNWDGYTWESPTTYKRFGLSRLKRDRDSGAREEYPVRIVGWRKVGDGLWLDVATLDASPCDGGTPRVVDRGWIPAYAAAGALVAGYHSRGC